MPDPTAPTYAFRPSIFVRERHFALGPEALTWQDGRRSGRIGYGEIDRIRLYGVPGGPMAAQQRCVLRPRRGPAILLSDTHYLGLGRTENRAAGYLPFARALLERVVAANPQVRLVFGQYWSLWVVWLVLLAGIVLVLLGGAMAAATGQLPWKAAPVFAILIAFLPAAWRVVRRGRPRRIDPRQLPASLVAD